MKKPLNRRLKEKRQKLIAIIENNGKNLSCEAVVKASQELDEVIVLIQKKGYPFSDSEEE